MFGDLGHGMIMTAFAAWMVLREKPLAAKKSDSEVLGLIFTWLSQYLQKFCDHFVCFVSEVLLTDSCFSFFPFARSGTSSLGAVTSFCWWVCTPCTRALSTMMCFQSRSTYLGRTGLSITTRRQLWQTRICSWILTPQTTTGTPIHLAWIQYGRWCSSLLWNEFLR